MKNLKDKTKKRLARYERLDSDAPTASVEFYRDGEELKILRKHALYRNDEDGNTVLVGYIQKVIDETENRK